MSVAVSVIIPNYNHERFLRRRIESVLGQTYQDFELILLDDCSTDNSRRILSEYAGNPRVRFDFNRANSGTPFRQWNKGVGMAQGKYMWIAESDDYADDHLLERLIEPLSRDDEITFAYCRSWHVTESDEQRGFVWPCVKEAELCRWAADFVTDGQEECRKYLLNANTVVNASAVVFKKDVYEAVGGPDESLRLCGDWKLWAAMALRGKIAYVSEPLNYQRFHNESMRAKSANNAMDFRESLRVIGWMANELRLSPQEREKLQRKVANVWVSLLMSLRIPIAVKGEILRELRTIDPQPLRRVALPAIATVQRKFGRYWRDARGITADRPAGKMQ